MTGTFYVSDAAATPPNTARVTVRVTSDAANGERTDVWDIAIDDSTSLTAAQRTNLKNYLSTLRDEALAALGFVSA